MGHREFEKRDVRRNWVKAPRAELKKEYEAPLLTLNFRPPSPSSSIILLIPRLVAKFAGYNHDDVRALREEIDKRVFKARHGVKQGTT